MINQEVTIHCHLLCIGLLCLVFVVSSNQCNPKKFDWKNKESIMFDEDRYPGEWYIINCSLPDNLINVSLWKNINDTKSQKKIVPDQHKVKEFNQVFNVTNLKSSDSGRYFCKACNRSDKERGILTIESDGKAYQRPKILNKPESNVSYGSKLEMDCEVTGYYEMDWYKDGDRIRKGRKMNISNLPGKTSDDIMHITKKRLTIRRFTEDEDGLYTCIAERPALQWKAENEVSLTVVKDGILLLKPRINKNPEFEKAGDNITMDCKSDGSVLMIWRKQGRNGTLTSQDVSFQRPVFNVTRKIFKILNFAKQDEGIYECRVNVKNRPWSVAETINITMKVKPTIKGNAIEVTTFKAEGKELKCELSTKAVPQANISWAQCVCDSNCSECKKRVKLQDTSSSTTTERNSEILSTLTIQKMTSERVIYRCRAENGAGSDEREWEVVKGNQENENDNTMYIIIISCIVILMLIFLLLTAVILYRRKKLYGGFYIFTVPPLIDYIGQLDEEKSLLEQSNKLPYISEWEYPRERVHLEKDIGKGAFGRVFLAKVIGISAFHPRRILEEKSKQNRFSVFRNRKRNSYLYCTFSSKVAVKMLNDNWNESNLSDLLTELKLLIHIGEHNNVVNILGACTKGDRGNAWIIMEYCEHGNLTQFLNERRILFENEWLAFSEDQNMSLSHSDLAAIALQVVFGMKFLVSRKCIHRDLAARNVLIGHDFVPKIADFGLARDVYKDEQYIKKNSGLLPIKWMSIEAIEDLIFSEKSDVWSFGILLWEIFAMGGSPYIGIQASEIYSYLYEGNRMQPPVFCPSEIYAVMFDCWKHKPEERPDFKTVEEKLSKILMDKNRPWIFAFELDEPAALPEK